MDEQSKTPAQRYHVPEWVKETPKIFPAIIAANRAIESVAKARKNAQQGYSFRGIDEVYNMIHGVLAEAGIVTVPSVLQRRSSERSTKAGGGMTLIELQVEYWFTAEDGSSLVVGPLWSEGLDNSDKGTNKALAFAQKYALLQVFTIPTADVAEGDQTTQERGAEQRQGNQTDRTANPIGTETASKVLAAFGSHGVTSAQLRAKLGCEVADAPVSMLEQLRSWGDAIAADKRKAVTIFGPSGSKSRAEELNNRAAGQPPQQ